MTSLPCWVYSVWMERRDCMILAVIIPLLILILFSKRYLPVFGLKDFNRHPSSSLEKGVIVVDTRDYQVSSKEACDGTLLLPLAYLRRYYPNISSTRVVLICADKVERNLAVRFLERKGFKVEGFYVPQETNRLSKPCLGE